MMDKFKLLKRFLTCVLCAGLVIGCLSMEAWASGSENADTEVVDSVFSTVKESEQEPEIFSAVLPVEESGEEKAQIANLNLATVADQTAPTINFSYGKSLDSQVTLSSNGLRTIYATKAAYGDGFAASFRSYFFCGFVESGDSSEVTSWQWQYSTDGETWMDIEEDCDAFPSSDGFGPTCQNLKICYGQSGPLVSFYYYRLKATGAWGDAYSKYSIGIVPSSTPDIRMKAKLSGTSSEYTNGPVSFEVTVSEPAFPKGTFKYALDPSWDKFIGRSLTGIYGYKVVANDAAVSSTDFVRQSVPGTYTVEMDDISAETTFYGWAKGIIIEAYLDDLLQTRASATIKVDTTAPTVTGASAYAAYNTSTKKCTVTVLVNAADDESGVAGVYVSATNSTPEPLAEGWSDNNAGTYASSMTTDDDSETLHYWVRDGAGNITYGEL